MNILYIDHYAGSPDMGMEFRPYYFGRDWQALGHQVTIVAGDYSHLRRCNPKVHADYQTENIDGITYVWFRTGHYQGNGVARALTMFRFCRKLSRYARRLVRDFKPDVVISSSTYPLDARPAHKIAHLAGARHIHEVHDMWPATLCEVGGLPRWHPFVCLLQRAENWTYRHVDQVVSLLAYAEPYMREHGLPEGHFSWIPNGIVLKDWEQPLPLPEDHRKLLERLHKERRFVIGYFGGHARSNYLDSLLDVAARMRDEPASFVLVGQGAEKEALEQRAKQESLDQVFFLPPISKLSVPSLLAAFDCVYIGANPSPLYRFGTSFNKLYDAMMAERPIVAVITTPSTAIEDCGCGYRLDADDQEGVVRVLRELMALPEEQRRAMGARGRVEIRNKYSYTILSKKFASLFEKSKLV